MTRSEYNKAYYAKNAEKLKTNARKWYWNNRERQCVLRKEYYRANREKIIARESDRYRENVEKKRAYNRMYAVLNKTRIRKSQQLYSQKNREKIYLKNRAYSMVNKDKQARWAKKWRNWNKSKQRVQQRLYAKTLNGRITYAKKLAKRGGRLANFEPEVERFYAEAKTAESVKCFHCGIIIPGRQCHIDHIIPISKGGQHAVENLCISCKFCNLLKGDKLNWSPPIKMVNASTFGAGGIGVLV